MLFRKSKVEVLLIKQAWGAPSLYLFFCFVFDFFLRNSEIFLKKVCFSPHSVIETSNFLNSSLSYHLLFYIFHIHNLFTFSYCAPSNFFFLLWLFMLKSQRSTFCLLDPESKIYIIKVRLSISQLVKTCPWPMGESFKSPHPKCCVDLKKEIRFVSLRFMVTNMNQEGSHFRSKEKEQVEQL